MQLTHHCAKFTDAILERASTILSDYLPWEADVLDPFAGTGKGVDYLRRLGFCAHGIELEPEWASQSQFVTQGTALELPFGAWFFDAVFTSPTYGNRMADKDLRESVAGTYAKSLGRLASEGSSCHLQWGEKYREFHREAWLEVDRVLKPGGYVLLNCKNHPRSYEEQKVTEWHVAQFENGMLYTRVLWEQVKCPGNRKGTNKDHALPYENLVLLRKSA